MTHSIRRQLARQGASLSWQTIKYFVTKYQHWDLDDTVLPDLNDNTAKFSKHFSSSYAGYQNIIDAIQQGHSSGFNQHRNTVSISIMRKCIKAAGFTIEGPCYCQLIHHANKLKRITFYNQLIERNDTLDNVIFPMRQVFNFTRTNQSRIDPKGSLSTFVCQTKTSFGRV